MTRAVWVSGATAVPLRKTGDVLLPGVGALATLESLGFMAGCVMRLGVAKHGPINVGAQVFAADGAVGKPLYVRAPFRGDSRFVLPLPNSPFRDAKGFGEKGSVPNETSRGPDGVLCSFHSRSIDYLYLEGKEKLSPKRALRNYPNGMKKEELSATARYVKDARARAKISQEKLGELIGCGKQNVSGWENDRHSPSPTQLASIVNHTGLPLPEELSPKGIPTPESIRTMPRDQVADSVITGMTEKF